MNLLNVINLKEVFGDTYVIDLDEKYYHEKPHLRDSIEHYYIIPAKYGFFCTWQGDILGLVCTSKRVKEKILGKLMGKVYLHLDCDFESILTFHRSLFHLIAPIAKAKRRRGRKKLSADEKNRFEEAGKRYRFTGKSRRFENLEFDFNATAERSFS